MNIAEIMNRHMTSRDAGIFWAWAKMRHACGEEYATDMLRVALASVLEHLVPVNDLIH
jgi:hypothetical protein